MQVEVIAVSIGADSFTGTAALVQVGTAADPDGILTDLSVTAAAVNATLDGALLVNGRAPIAAGGDLQVTAATVAASTVEGLQVVITGYVTAHATNIQSD
jgi:hypothetical protein